MSETGTTRRTRRAAIFQAYREMIQESDSDEVFYSAVYSTLFRLGTYGHLWIVEPDMYRAYCEAYEDGGLQDREHGGRC